MSASNVALYSVYVESRVHHGVYFFEQKFYGKTAEYRASLRADEITHGKGGMSQRRPKRKTLIIPGYPGETVDASGKLCKNPSRATMPPRREVLEHVPKFRDHREDYPQPEMLGGKNLDNPCTP